MATITTKNIKQIGGMVTAPYGNDLSLKYHFETNASGVYVNSDQTTAVIATNVVRLGIIPAGMELFDVLGVISVASSATITADVGFAYVDGVDDTNVPQDAAYFNDNQALSTAAIFRKTGIKAPVKLPKDAYLTMLNNTATHAQACVVDVIVKGIWHGSPSSIPT